MSHELPVIEQICIVCYKPCPAAGWFHVEDGDEGREFFCSETCYEETRPD
jgi:hypothetical protein